MTPTITAITVTYGRVRLLEEAVAAFLAQDVTSPADLVILNTCPDQELIYTGPGRVTIYNLPVRPASLGEARNLAIEQAVGEVIVIWDDDDVPLSNHLSTIANAFTPELDWIYLDAEFYSEENRIKKVVPGGCPMFAFRKSAWKDVGGYPSLTVGEDRKLLSLITSSRPGHRITPATPTRIYRWGLPGLYHASGLGDDKAGQKSAHERVRLDLERRIRMRQEPTGKVILEPNLRNDYEALAKAFLSNSASSEPQPEDVCFVCLGRFGDVLNVFPLFLHVHNTYRKPYVMISREFASVLDGISYVTPYPVDLPNNLLIPALDMAHRKFRHVILCQIWGENWKQEKLCPAYNMESWRQAGFLGKWMAKGWVPMFDRRDKAREDALSLRLQSSKPLLLVALTGGVSSPFPAGGKLLEAIRTQLGEQFDILDLESMKLHRIYDALRLLDNASCLVSTDTAWLHLAAATAVPTVALVNEKPWLGTRPRGNALSIIPYNEATPAEVITAIGQCRDHFQCFDRTRICEPPQRRLYHAIEFHAPLGRDDRMRRDAAQKSWTALYNQGTVSIVLDSYPRDAATLLGDRRPLPFLKDVLAKAITAAQSPDDIIFWTNDDDWLHPDLAGLLRFHVAVWDCCTAHRCEFRRPIHPGLSAAQYARTGEHHIGRDLAAATKRWWVSHWEEIPDFVLGASEFDLCLAAMIRREHGYHTTRQNIDSVFHPAELPRGYICHQFHKPFWDRPDNRDSAPSQQHNRKLFKLWAENYCPDLKLTGQGIL